MRRQIVGWLSAGLLLVALPLQAQPSLLQSGPMVGFGDMREVLLWVQTTREATVKFRYFEEGAPATARETAEVQTQKQTAYTAKLYADQVQPGRRYTYELFINGRKVERPYPLRFQTQTLWQWRTDPPPFKMVIGSCFYVNETEYDRPGQPYGGEFQILDHIYRQQPDLMLWLGDNVYLREVDWNTRTGIMQRYTHTRSLPELQPLLGSIHHYAIWDDHDFGPNNSDRSFGMKPVTLEAFRLFWGNPYFGIDGQPGITSSFEWADMHFFLLDNRYHRSPNDRVSGERALLGDAQLQWLIDALVASQAPFKFVVIGGQVLNPVLGYESYATYGAERERLLSALQQENIPGVIFLSGDRHRSEISKLERRGTYPLYDITISPLTAGTYPASRNDNNALRLPETTVNERNFAVFEFSGPRREREVRITCINSNGERKWTFNIKAADLR